MKNILAILFFFLTLGFANAQLSVGGQPYSLLVQSQANGRTVDLKSNFKSYNSIDNEVEILRAQKIKEECPTCRSDFYGTGIDVDLDIKRDGRRFKVAGGTLWKLDVSSENSFGLQFYFDQYILPPEAELFIYNQAGKVLGAFTHINNHPDEKFATALISGESATIEYFESDNRSFPGSLSIYKVIHSFRNTNLQNPNSRNGFGDSAECNEDISCYSGYDAIKESIARIAYYDSENNICGHCSGYLINNTYPSQKAFLLTADHCLGYDDPAYNIKAKRYHEWIIQFDYQKEDCNNTFEPSPLKTTNGAKLLTRSSLEENYGTDHALLDLEIPFFADIYKVPYLGFDRSVASSSSTVGIHHPKGDVKKISFDQQSPQVVSELPFTNKSNMWKVIWNQGIMEGGSSGSPLIQSSNMLAIGLLSSGHSNCTTDDLDYYPSIGYSWDKKDERFAWDLGHFLDYDNPNRQTLESYIPEGVGGDPDPPGGDDGNGNGVCPVILPNDPPYLGVPISSFRFPTENCLEGVYLPCYNNCDHDWKVSHGKKPKLCGSGVIQWDVAQVSGLNPSPSEMFTGGIYRPFAFENDKEYIITYRIYGGPSNGASSDRVSRWKFYTKAGVWNDREEECGQPVETWEIGWSSRGLISQHERTKADYRGWKTYASRFVPYEDATQLLIINESNHGSATYLMNVELYEAEYFDAKTCDDQVSFLNDQVSVNTYARRDIEAANTTVNSISSPQFESTVEFQAPKITFKDGFKAPHGSNFRTKEGRCNVVLGPNTTEVNSSIIGNRILDETYQVDYSKYQPIYAVSDIEIYTDEFKKSLDRVLIYPNPTRGIVNIENSFDEVWEYSLMDISGRVLLKAETTKGAVSVDLSGFNGNLFLIRIINSKNENSVVRKIYKK